MVRVGVLGATGYTALELIKVLLRHPEVEFTAFTSRQEGSPSIATVHRELTGLIDVPVEQVDLPQVAAKCDCVFSCLPHAASASSVMQLLELGARVVDFSADYRLRDLATYQEWYGEHPDPERLGKVVYGLPELFRQEIRSAQVVANPGCYTSTAILGLAPFLCRNIIEPTRIIVDAKSGVSGAGRAPKLTTLFPECNESVSAYSLGKHRHQPEIEQVLTLASSQNVQVLFAPHLIPMDRGIICTIYTRPTEDITEEQGLELVREFYADSPFVRVVEHLPATKHVVDSNFCDITVRRVREELVIISCTDNLLKGASGVAVQNFNLMHGFDETAGFKSVTGSLI